MIAFVIALLTSGCTCVCMQRKLQFARRLYLHCHLSHNNSFQFAYASKAVKIGPWSTQRVDAPLHDKLTTGSACVDMVSRNGTIRCTDTPFAAITSKYVEQHTVTLLIKQNVVSYFMTCKKARVTQILQLYP